MSKPTENFWMAFGMALIILAFSAGFALMIWASGGK